MDSDRIQPSDEIRLGEVAAVLWDAKLLIGVVTAVCLAIGAAAYFLIPPSYTSKVSVLPLGQTQFSSYIGLAQEGELPGFVDPNKESAQPPAKPKEEGVFPYTPATLFTEFVAYATDLDRLSAIAEKIEVVPREGLSEADYRERIAGFVSGVRFTMPKLQETQAGVQFLNIEAKAGDKDKLAAFMRQMLLGANKDLATSLAADVRLRADEIKDRIAAQTAKLQIDIDARRHTQEGVRTDNMARLAEQSAIARTLNIQKPINLQAVEAAEQGKATAAQINTSGDQKQPDYLQGYTALEESIAALKSRKDSDPFIEDLRAVELQLYAIKNDPRPARIQTLLERSPLSDPATAVMARFSVASISAEKTFPRLSTFGAGALLFGLALGSIIALLRNSRY